MDLKRVAMYGAAAAGIVLARRWASKSGVASDRGCSRNRVDQGLRDTEIRRNTQVRSALGVSPSGEAGNRGAAGPALGDTNSSDIFQSP